MGSGGGILDRIMDRRQFIGAVGVTAGAAALTLANTQCDSALVRKIQQQKTATPPRHRAWVWQFSADGRPEQIAASLAADSCGVMMKTHDGLEWMSTYDHTPDAITGPQQVQTVASIFERNGVPFHAWSVIKGIDPVREAQMAADVLAAGARSLTLDLEGSSGFWVAGAGEAQRFGDELRRLTPFGRVDISIDPRPWRINLVPMNEFVVFTDAILPQLYWDTFDSGPNIDGYRRSGYPPPNGMSPEFLLDATASVLAQYNRPILPVGQGAAADPATWPRFAHRAWALQMESISVWRYGVTPTQTLRYLGLNPPGQEPQAPPATPTPQPSATARPNATATQAQTSTPSPSRTARPTRTPTATDTPLAVSTPPPTP